MQNPLEFYKLQLKNTEEIIQKLRKKLILLSWARGISFLLGFGLTYFAFATFSATIGVFALVISLTLLMFFVKKYLQRHEEMKHYKRIALINENELKALDYDFSVFATGDEFVNPKHDFSFDLDLFGNNSLYQMINRSSTRFGKNKVAEYLNNLLKDKTRIENTQKAVAELCKIPEWQQVFLSNAVNASNEVEKNNFNLLRFSTKKTKHSIDVQNLKKVTGTENIFSKLIWKILLIVLPAISILLMLLAFIGIIPDSVFFVYSMIMLGVVGGKLKYLNSVHSRVSKQSKIFKRYSVMLDVIEKEVFKSQLLIDLQEKLKIEDKKASVILRDFSKLLNAFDNRLNFLFAFVANALVLYDIQVVRRIEQWQKKYSANFDDWFEVIAEFEFLISLSTFAFNNPTFTFPTVSKEFAFESKDLGHPLISHNQRVTSDFAISKKTKTFIITGANMAGKSTFLRTIGSNSILAQIGSVVCAKEMVFSPIRILTSIRITDSLSSNESYFYAELKRLKYIVELVESGEEALIIIDEMLRGTNSEDKHSGSEGLLRKLTKRNVITFLATHDVALGKLENEFVDELKNYCFEAEIKNDELFFDYKLHNGVSQNLNASFLMKKMKII